MWSHIWRTMKLVESPILWIFLAAVLALQSWQLAHLSGDLRHILTAQALAQEHLPMTISSSWPSNGITITVTTVQQEGETIEEVIARHHTAVETALEQFPKD